MNPKHARKMTQIEDFVHVLPTSAESYLREEINRDVYSLNKQNSEGPYAIESDPLLSENMLAIEYEKPAEPEVLAIDENHVK